MGRQIPVHPLDPALLKPLFHDIECATTANQGQILVIVVAVHLVRELKTFLSDSVPVQRTQLEGDLEEFATSSGFSLIPYGAAPINISLHKWW
jgi:hypothetical protein